MALQGPVIDSAISTPATLVEGGTSQVKVAAHDPNGRNVTVGFVVTVNGLPLTGSVVIPVSANAVTIGSWTVIDPENVATIVANSDGVSATLKV
jgi:hypothetical protein